jgi:hypothetical protein
MIKLTLSAMAAREEGDVFYWRSIRVLLPPLPACRCRRYRNALPPGCGTLSNRNRSRTAPLVTDFGVSYYDSQTAKCP